MENTIFIHKISISNEKSTESEIIENWLFYENEIFSKTRQFDVSKYPLRQQEGHFSS